MPRTLIISILALVLSASVIGVGAPEAQAQDAACQSCLSACQQSYLAGEAADEAAVISCQESCAPKCGGDKAVASTPPPTTQQAKSGQNMPVEYGVDSGYNAIMIKIMSLFAWLVGVAAITLDNAVYYTVVTMGNYINNLSAVGVTWRIMRDIGNILLIFGFLAIGISTILGTTLYGWGSKLLPKLLMAAVFLNFSLFITEAIIDTGNLFATQFYTQINGGVPAGAKDIGLSNIANATSDGIAGKIMGQLGLQTMYGKATTNSLIFEGANPWFIGFMGILLFTVTAFVLFSLAFMFIARFVILLFLIIVAPVGFAGWAVPKLSGIADKWWGALTKQTLAAPLLLLLLYIALTVITDAHFLTGFGGNPDWTGYLTGSSAGIAGFAGMMLSFLVAMGLLLAVIMASKSLSTFGAGWATKTAGKVTYGAAAWAGRTTVGWGANRAAKSLRGTAFARVPLVGTGVVKGLDRVATGSFDMRGTKTFGSVGKAMSFNAGDAQKGGYRSELKSRIDSRMKYAKDLTGRELTEEEKIEQKVTQTNIKATEKGLMDAKIRQRTAAAVGEDTRLIDEEIASEKEILSGYQTKLEKIESVTDKGAQRKYAKALELGLNEKSTFNKFNFAANTEAAKKIRGEAKKSSDDKTLDALKAALKKVGGEGGEEKPKKEEKKEEPKPEAAK